MLKYGVGPRPINRRHLKIGTGNHVAQCSDRIARLPHLVSAQSVACPLGFAGEAPLYFKQCPLATLGQKSLIQRLAFAHGSLRQWATEQINPAAMGFVTHHVYFLK